MCGWWCSSRAKPGGEGTLCRTRWFTSLARAIIDASGLIRVSIAVRSLIGGLPFSACGGDSGRLDVALSDSRDPVAVEPEAVGEVALDRPEPLLHLVDRGIEIRRLNPEHRCQQGGFPTVRDELVDLRFQRGQELSVREQVVGVDVVLGD